MARLMSGLDNIWNFKFMTKYLFSKILLLLILMTAVPSGAAGLNLQDYPGARTVFRSEDKVDEYRLALSSYKKSEGIWQAERQQRLRGKLTRITQELPSNHSAQAGFEFYLEQLQQFNRRELFFCRARDCGTSNTWANNHFKIIQLYGLDQFQFYGAYEVMTESPTPLYISIYAVQRGNKRVYVHIDILHSDKARIGSLATNPDTVIALLESNGFYVFPDPVVDNKAGQPELQISSDHLQTLVTVLQRQPNWRIALVGHDYHAATLTEQQRQSKIYAERLQAGLAAKGIDADRMAIFGLGSLAPAGRGDLSARVEVVLLQ